MIAHLQRLYPDVPLDQLMMDAPALQHSAESSAHGHCRDEGTWTVRGDDEVGTRAGVGEGGEHRTQDGERETRDGGREAIVS